MKGQRVIGFDRKILQRWLDFTFARVAEGESPDRIHSLLHQYLLGEIAGTAEKGAQYKTVTVLQRVWVRMPDALAPLRDDAVALWQEMPVPDPLVFHWGMALATYPFFYDAASIVGRLLRLQEEARLAEVTRRLKESWGDRPQVPHAARRILRSMVEWGVLQDTGTRGVYQGPMEPFSVAEPRVRNWLMEALLRGSGVRALPYRNLASAPAVFPFSWNPRLTDLRLASRLESARQGLDEDVVMLRG